MTLVVDRTAGALKRLMAFVCFGLVLFAQPWGQAQGADALPFSKIFLITGNYVVGGVDLAPQTSANGFNTGVIPMSGVPANADVLAAFLYWETISTQVSQVDGARFRGSPMPVVKASSTPLNPTTAPCWSSGGGSGATYRMTMYRADVLRLLPEQVDASGNPTGKRLVNDTDLQSHGFAPHSVTLPERNGNQVPSSAGATLFVVYRDPTQPLTSITVFDGISVQAPGATTTQPLRGFLQSSTTHVAKMTQVVGSGAGNSTDRLRFKGSLIATDPFQASATPSSDRGWSTRTFDVTSLMPGTDLNDGYGEQVTTAVDHGKT